jgi:translation initiation factor 4G
MQKAIAILNKLSVETFDKLSDQFLNIGMETEAIMGRVVDLIVSKAQMEEHFCFMYADLCKKITEKWVSEELSEEQQAAAAATAAAVTGGGGHGDDTTGFNGLPDLGKAFRVRLLSRCQEEFQQDREAAIQAIHALELPIDEQEERLYILKKRYTGHMRFIGEIYMKDLLKPSRVYSSIEELLHSRDEEKLACLMKLLQTVGKKLEAYDVKKKKAKVMKYFNEIQILSTDHQLSTKIRFGFKDLIEMRGNNWTARREEEKAKKLSEIRASAGMGMGMGPISSGSQGPSSGTQMRGGMTTGSHGGGGGGGGGARPIPMNDARAISSQSPATTGSAGNDDWSTVPIRGNNKKSSALGGKQMGPSSRGAIPSKGTPTPTSNKFSALNQSTPTSSSHRTGKTKSRARDEENEEEEEGKSGPKVSIPQSSLSSTFSPDGGDEMMMSPTTAHGADGILNEAMTTRVCPLSLPLSCSELTPASLSLWSGHLNNE